MEQVIGHGFWRTAYAWLHHNLRYEWILSAVLPSCMTPADRMTFSILGMVPEPLCWSGIWRVKGFYLWMKMV